MDTQNTQISALNIGDQVTVTVKSIDEMGLLVTMNDYHTEGFIPLSEAYKSKMKSKRKVGDQYLATIIRIDKERGFVDLSLKN